MAQIIVKLLAKQLALAHQVLDDTIDSISDEQLHWTPKGKAHNIASSYGHVVVQEDVVINVLLKGGSPSFTQNFAERTGLSEIPPLPTTEIADWSNWSKLVKLNLAAAKAYGNAVFANTDAFLASITDEDLDQSIDTGFLGTMSKLELINLTVLANCIWHTGEISTVKGLQDLKGYPF